MGVKTSCPSSENFIRGIMNDAGKQAALCSKIPKRYKERHPFFRKEECVHSEEREDAPPHKAADVVGENCAKSQGSGCFHPAATSSLWGLVALLSRKAWDPSHVLMSLSVKRDFSTPRGKSISELGPQPLCLHSNCAIEAGTGEGQAMSIVWPRYTEETLKMSN